MDYPVCVADPIPFTRKQRLGAGSAGEVWLAEGPAGLVAVKMAIAGRSLAAEIGSLARVRHPNVPALVAADRQGTWLARGFVEGARLTSWAHGRPLAERLACFVKLGRAVAAIHDVGVLHGDLSPANILVDEAGEPFVLDLGADTRGGALGWMPPERLRGEPVSVRGDVYGLGALLYALCTGRPPYERGGGAALGFVSGASLPLPPRALVPELPAAIEEAALRALAWTATSRQETVTDLVEAVLAGLDDEPPPPIVGMLEERERLRRMVVDGLRGELSLVVVHGPPGSGRATLVHETARAAAREGFRVTEASLPTAREVLANASDTDVVVLDAAGGEAGPLVELLEARTEAVMVLVRSDVSLRALSRRGAVHVRPVALTLAEVTLLARLRGEPPARAERVYARSEGCPGVVTALLDGRVPPGPPLTPELQRLMAHIEQGGASLPELAALVDLTEHHTLNLLEPLMARGVVWSSPSGELLFGALGPL
ncbi:hypothetical protein LBMAG42_36490 [Deltaproteobacteria bacterium]|nr:hypothetical protein LBMAG42_36490 [Deltaproteobacteria bacterium]